MGDGRGFAKGGKCVNLLSLDLQTRRHRPKHRMDELQRKTVVAIFLSATFLEDSHGDDSSHNAD